MVLVGVGGSPVRKVGGRVEVEADIVTTLVYIFGVLWATVSIDEYPAERKCTLWYLRLNLTVA